MTVLPTTWVPSLFGSRCRQRSKATSGGGACVCGQHMTDYEALRLSRGYCFGEGIKAYMTINQRVTQHTLLLQGFIGVGAEPEKYLSYGL